MNELAEKTNLLNELLGESNWRITHDNSDIVTESKFVQGSTIDCFRSYGVVNASMEDISKFLWQCYGDIENLKLLDSTIVEFDILETFKEKHRICRQVNTLTWPIWPRESVYYQYITNIDDKITIIIMWSITHDSAPLKHDKYVRSNINVSALYLEKMSDNQTMVTRIAHIDPAGYLPTGIINSFAHKTRNIIEFLQKKFISI